MVGATAAAARQGEAALSAVLARVPAAIYVTDRDGRVTHFSEACTTLAGRQPVANEDRWCVTWKLYTPEGEFLPHDECPMAVSLRENRKVRGLTAVAERPDGTRVNFMPFPTPILDDGGEVIGAVNLLVDLDDPAHQDFCRVQAAKCRRYAASIGQNEVGTSLLALASEYEGQLPRKH